MDIGIEGGDLTLSKLVGYGFFFVCLLQPRACFRRLPGAMWFFVIYALVYIIEAVAQYPLYWELALSRFWTVLQMLMLFWISHNLLRDERVARTTVGTLAASCVILAVLQLLGVTSVTYHGVEGRVSALGEDPNVIGAAFSLGLVALVGLAYGQSRSARKFRYLSWTSFAIVALAVTRTGSRGALVALAAGLAVLVLRRGGVGSRLRNLAIVLLGLLALLWISLKSETYVARWELTLQRGSMAGRERIFRAAWQMFLEKPVEGWGPVTHFFVLGHRVNRPGKSTHNLVLWVLTEVGLLGGAPYVLALIICLRAGWLARRGPRGVLPLAMLVTVLVINMSLAWQYHKFQWVVLAYATASGSLVAEFRKRGSAGALRSPLAGRRVLLGQPPALQGTGA